MKQFFYFLFLALPLFSKPLISAYAINSKTGEVLLDQNSDLSMTPASCLKLITTATALHLLGPDSRFTTDLEYDGFIQDGTLHGNLYLHGGGDPCLGAKDWQAEIKTWVSAIQELGIKKIEGCIIGDASAWEQALAVPSWTWEDLGNYYGAGASALSFHENSYTLVFKPAKEIGKKATILRTSPPQFDLVLQSEVTTGAKGSGDQACIYGSEFSNLQCIRGTIPAAVEEFAIKGAIPDPAAYTARLLQNTLEKQGICIIRQKIAPTSRTKFHTTYSPTIAEIVHQVNKRSMNLYAEHLLKKMGGGSTSQGVKKVKEFWQSEGISLDDFQMVDGSGLSRTNLISTKQLVTILVKMKKSPYFSTFLNSLPNGRKSGTMSLIKGCAGYKDDIVFAFLVNQCPDRERKELLIEKLHDSLAGKKKK